MSNSVNCPACGSTVELTGSEPLPCPYCGTTLQPGLSAEPAAFQPANLDEVKAQIVLGNKIEAIRLYREATGVGLKEAKDAVEAMERGEEVAALPVSNKTMVVGASSLDQVRVLALSGQKVAAISRYRELTGADLAAAKDAVEAMARGESVEAAIAAVSAGAAASSQFANSAELMDEVKRLLRAEKKIEAVKVYREYFNCGLAEAKDAVDAAETELKLQAPPPLAEDEVPSFARPDAAPAAASSGPVVMPNPVTAETSGPPAWRNWAIGCGIALVLFCCLCVVLPAIVSLVMNNAGGS